MHEPSYQQMVAPAVGNERISLPTRHSYTEDTNGPRAVANPDNHLGFSQHLRQSQQRVTDTQPLQSPISQLATNMVFQRVMPPRASVRKSSGPQQNTAEPASLFQGMNPDRFNQLQPAKQQITPPFNLSEL